ncbi:hypothetical protein DVK00_10790 [Haloarcula sp. Atlit-47R]|nr:hypothetical protein DVK00_10790 [Haloarcula sp. Atlit-47R]
MVPVTDSEYRETSPPVLSPSKRGSGRENLPQEHKPEVSGSIDWSEYTAYRCCICQDNCINKIDSDYARARECRHCYAVPTLDRHSVDDPALDR